MRLQIATCERDDRGSTKRGVVAGKNCSSSHSRSLTAHCTLNFPLAFCSTMSCLNASKEVMERMSWSANDSPSASSHALTNCSSVLPCFVMKSAKPERRKRGREKEEK